MQQRRLAYNDVAKKEKKYLDWPRNDEKRDMYVCVRSGVVYAGRYLNMKQIEFEGAEAIGRAGATVRPPWRMTESTDTDTMYVG